jgi:hypothetical protein
VAISDGAAAIAIDTELVRDGVDAGLASAASGSIDVDVNELRVPPNTDSFISAGNSFGRGRPRLLMHTIKCIAI